MSNIRSAARAWLRKELNNPEHSQFNLGWEVYKRNIAASKYYVAEEAFPKIPVWFLGVPIVKVQKMESCDSFFLLCQKRVGDISEFHLLVVPKSYLLEHHQNGNLAILNNGISLELSVEKCRYKGHDINVFDDVCATRRLRRCPIPFGQFQVT